MSQNNLVTIDYFNDEITGTAASYASFATVSGIKMLKVISDYVRGTREVDIQYDPSWVLGIIKPGDHIVWKIKTKTDPLPIGQVNTDYTGSRIGCDLLVRNDAGLYRTIMDSKPGNYTYINNVLVSSDSTQAPVSRFQLPYGQGTSTIYWDFIVPTTYFTQDNGLGGGTVEFFSPRQILSFAPWVDARELIGPDVYFWDPELYINSTPIQKFALNINTGVI